MANLQGWEYLLGEICIGMCLVFGIFYFNKARKTADNMHTLKQLNLGIGILFLFLFISRIIDNPLGTMTDPTRTLNLFSVSIVNQQVHDIGMLFDYENVLFGSIKNGFFVNMLFLLGLAIATFFMERAFIPKARHIFFIMLLVCAFVAFVPLTGQMIDIFDPPTFTEATWVSPIPWQDWFVILPYFFTALGYISFAVIPIIYFILAGKTTGDLRRNALLLAFGFIFILVDIHTVGHAGAGNWYRSVPCLLGFLFIGLGNVQR